MSAKKGITPEEHKRQIDAYTAAFPKYQTFAAAMKRVLEDACSLAIPEAQTQSRPKSISSFAEKCARKWEKYPDPVKDMTDLCGARVIVQTLGQVRAVRQFIEANFEVLEKDDKELLLGQDEFGYRDFHYIVRLKPGHDLGLTATESKAVGDKRAEIQVRTWVQHAWADTLHDRMYKAKLKFSPELKRTGALLAALMEDSDRVFDRLTIEIDGMLANYSAYASSKAVDEEAEVLRLILANEPDADKKPLVALRLAKLLAAGGGYLESAAVLEPFAGTAGPVRVEIDLELGFALCKDHRDAPKSAPYRRGQKLIEGVVDRCAGGDLTAVPNLRKRRSLYARALARLAWTLDVVPGEAHRARTLYAKAFETERTNPYYLADVLGYEVHCGGNAEFIRSMSATLREGISVCEEQARNGTEMPYACFTAGRLRLLLGEDHDALADYCRGIRHLLAGTHCVPKDILEVEEEWILRVVGARPLTKGCLWINQLLELTKRVADLGCEAAKTPADVQEPLTPPVLIVSGGAASLKNDLADRLRPMLAAALEGFRGTVISGGTTAGIPGLVGEIAGEFADRHAKGFTLRAYIPRHLPHDAPEDDRYDKPPVVCGDGFSPEQILKSWQDILDSGIDPATVSLIGMGGGILSAVEYRMALAFGAKVAVVRGSGGSADAVAEDGLWAEAANLLVLPFDAETIRAFIMPPTTEFEADVLESMAQMFHANFVAESPGRLPDNMKPWKKLKDTYKTANREQAKYSVTILEACGFEICEAKDPEDPVIFDSKQFTEAEVERMAEMEHGRWNVERLRDGWRYGKEKIEAKKLHDCLVPWASLSDGPDGVKRYDRDGVRKFPEVLAKAGLEVHRRQKQPLPDSKKRRFSQSSKGLSNRL